MSAKQLLRLAALLAVLLLVWGAAALASRRGGNASGEAFHLPKIKRSAVDTVALTRPADTAVLVRKDSSTWTVNGHPASPQAVAELLDALEDTTATGELVAERKTSQAGLGVDSATGTRVKVRGHGQTLVDIIAGKRSTDFAGGYVRRADQESTWQMPGRLVDILSRKSDEWRDRRIATVSGDSIAAIEVSRGARRYTLRRSGGTWALAPGGAADSSRAADLASAYGSVTADGFASEAQADSARFAQPDRKTRLLRKDGTPLVTLLFDSTKGAFWVKPDTGRTVYRIEAWTADRLAPADSTVRAKPPTKHS
jgi:hypothetical protein